MYFVYFVVALPAGQLAYVIAKSQQRSPTARPGISIPSAVSVDRYLVGLCCKASR